MSAELSWSYFIKGGGNRAKMPKMLLIFLLFGLLSPQGALAGISDLQLKNAFADEKGNLIVRFRYQRSDLGPHNPDLGSNILFWGNEKGLFQQRSVGFSGSNIRHFDHILDPRMRGGVAKPSFSLTTSADRDFSGDTNNDSVTLRLSGDVLAVMGTTALSGKSEAFVFRPLPDDQLMRLEQQIQRQHIPIYPYKPVRRPGNIYQVQKSEEFIYIDSIKGQPRSVRVFMGPIAQLRRVSVVPTNTMQRQETEPRGIQLVNGDQILFGGLYSRDDVTKDDSRAKYNGETINDGQQILLIRKDQKPVELVWWLWGKRRAALKRELIIRGVYEPPPVRTPADLFFPQQEMPDGCAAQLTKNIFFNPLDPRRTVSWN